MRDLILDTGTLTNIKLYACGDFTAYNGIAVNEILRINCSTGAGLNDGGFGLTGGGPNGTANGTVWCMNKQGDGKIIIGGQFTTYNNFSALNVTRIFPAASSNEAKTSTIYYDSEPEIDISNINEITIYPNPTSGLVQIKISNTKKYQATIYNLLGQKIMEQIDVVDSTTINLSSLHKGTYIIVLRNGDETITKTLLIK